MIKALKNILSLISIALAFTTCQKEFSFEGGGFDLSAGSLQSDNNGACLSKIISGIYIVATPLSANNSIIAQVNVTQPGSYKISTDTINGYFFTATGNFDSSGLRIITLKGKGTPLTAGNNIFTINYNNSSCDVAINVLSAGSPGAEFSLQEAGGSCLGAIVNGLYMSNVPLTGLNSVVLTVNVTKAGNYSVSTSATNGMIFSASGNFTTTGSQTITLQGSGAPVNTGLSVMTISAGGGTCNFSINVSASSTFDYYPRTANSNWTYEIDDNALDSARFFFIPATLNALGNNYNILMVARGAALDSSGYYRKAGSEYYRYMNLGDFIGFDSALWGEYKFIDDAVPVGTNWKTTAYNGLVTIGGLPQQPMTIRFSTSVLEKDITLALTTSLGTVDYSNVIVIEEKYERLLAGSWVDITSQVGSFKKYYARDIGMIKYEAYNNAGALSAFAKLRRYQVF